MVVLKKIKAATLMETLVATVLIMIVFGLASITLNQLFSNTIKNDTQAIYSHLNELEYLLQHNLVQIPYNDTFNKWNITLTYLYENNTAIVEFEAKNQVNNKTILYEYHTIP